MIEPSFIQSLPLFGCLFGTFNSSSSRVFRVLRCVGLGWLITRQALLGYRRQHPLYAFQRTCGDVKGSEVSLGRFFQDLFVQREVGNRSLQSGVFLLELLESFCLVEVESAALTASPITGVVGDTDRSYCLTNTLNARDVDLDLPELVQDLLRTMTFS